MGRILRHRVMDGKMPFDPEETLRQHGGFVRAVARRLVLDDSRADDVSQQTWLAALEHPPSRERGIRAWFATVARNFSFRSHREDRRRAERERLSARSEACA